MHKGWWAFALCIAALVPYALIVFFFMTRSPWFASWFGRSFLLSKLVILLLVSHVLVVLILGNYEGRLLVWALLFALLAVAGTVQLIVLLNEQRKDRRAARSITTEESR